MEIRWIQILAVFVFAGCSVMEASVTSLCGGELVDAMQVVCGDRGFTFGRLTSQPKSRRNLIRIVEECCFVGCDPQLLEQICLMPSQKRNVKSKREAVPVPSPLTKEVPQKSVIAKSSTKYDLWQRKAIQRMRRDIPAILRTWTFRKPAEIKAQ